MNVAVRYYSRSGNTKLLAEAIAEAAETSAVSVDSPQAGLDEPVDVLFIGGALYAYGIDAHLKEYLKSLKKENVKKAVVFSTTWISKHSIDLIKKGLEEQGIEAAEEALHFRGRPNDRQLEQAKVFAKKFLQ
jgi:flavorubredoxin